MRETHRKPNSSYEEWHLNSILFRGVLSGVAVLLLIHASEFQEAGKSVWTLFTGVAAGCAVLVLLSWRTVFTQIESGLSTLPAMKLRSRLLAVRLNYRANRIRSQRLTELLIDLAIRRQSLKEFWQSSPEFTQYAKSTIIFVLQGDETPLATIVFSDALKAVGLEVKTYGNFQEWWTRFQIDLASARQIEYFTVVIGKGIEHALAAHLFAEFFRLPILSVPVISLFKLSQSGAGLFPEEFLYHFPVEFHSGVKEYLRRAASLAQTPKDPQLQDREMPVPPPYR